jgi:hypothetical protein
MPAGYFADSINALIRIPGALRDRAAIDETDRVLIGLAEVTGLHRAMRSEAGERFPWPDLSELRLNDDLRAVIAAVRDVAGRATRSRR